MRIVPDSTSQSVYVRVTDAFGQPKTGLVYNSSGAMGVYIRQGASATTFALATLAFANSAYSSGGFKEVDATNAPGFYRLDIPDAALVTGVNQVYYTVVMTNYLTSVNTIDLQATSSDAANIAAIKAVTDTLSLAAIADGVWDEALSGHATAGTAGKALTDIEVDTTAIQSQTYLDSVAETVLKLDWDGLTGEAARSALNALRMLRNKNSITGATQTIYKEDDTTSAYTMTLTTSTSTDIVTGVTPV